MKQYTQVTNRVTGQKLIFNRSHGLLAFCFTDTTLTNKIVCSLSSIRIKNEKDV